MVAFPHQNLTADRKDYHNDDLASLVEPLSGNFYLCDYHKVKDLFLVLASFHWTKEYFVRSVILGILCLYDLGQLFQPGQMAQGFGVSQNRVPVASPRHYYFSVAHVSWLPSLVWFSLKAWAPGCLTSKRCHSIVDILAPKLGILFPSEYWSTSCKYSSLL